jgi:hypothetical protein
MIRLQAPRVLLLLAALLLAAPARPAVGPRVLEAQTRASVERDYLLAWQSLTMALSENRPDLLNEYFVGLAKDKLTETIREQRRAGIQTIYGEPAHDFHVVFYSPDGLSIQLLDNAAYSLHVRDHGKAVGSGQVHSRYVAVMTPTETKWKVRILQAQAQGSSGD